MNLMKKPYKRRLARAFGLYGRRKGFLKKHLLWLAVLTGHILVALSAGNEILVL